MENAGTQLDGDVPKLDISQQMEGMSLQRRKLLAAQQQDSIIIEGENRQMVRKLSENLVNAAFNEVAREIYMNTPRK
jgi:hypothetical protein